MSTISRPALLIFGLCLFLASGATECLAERAKTVSHSTATRPAADGIPSEATILKRAIVSSLAVRSVGENNPAAYNEWNDNITDLLVLFDRFNSPDDLKIFADLSAYYMGEAAGAVYDCIAVRKGSPLKPYLLESLETGRAECEETFRDAARYDGLKNSVCQDLTLSVRSIVAEIESGQRCSNSELAGAMGL